ncbi:MAG: hypothetical protein GC159_11130 [Phycisphaera sp.]|nr:hypothetical protein [Phycisphaera sp.]
MQRKVAVVVFVILAGLAGIFVGLRGEADAVRIPTKPGDSELVKQLTPDQSTKTLTRYASDPDTRVAKRAVLMLANPARPEAVPVVFAVARDPRPEVREAAVAGLGSFHRDDVDRNKVAAILAEDHAAEVRAAAARSLGTLQAWEGMPALVKALRDDDLAVRRSAYGAIKKMLGRDYGYVAEDTPAANAAAIRKIETVWPGMEQAHDDYLKRLESKR